MFEFLTGEKLAFSTYREESFRRVCAILKQREIPFRAKIEGSGVNVQYSDTAKQLGSRGIDGAEYKIYVKKDHYKQAEELAHVYK